MPDNENKEKKCRPISISLFVAPKGDKHHITLGVTKGCTDSGEATWAITFLLEEKDGDNWKKRVDFKLDINVEAPAKTDKAEKLADAKRLNGKQADFASGPMYVAAVRESRNKVADADLLAFLQADADAFDEQKDSSSDESSAKIGEALANFADSRRRPGLKELSIMFLDI